MGKLQVGERLNEIYDRAQVEGGVKRRNVEGKFFP
jgi:hypothetical protein